MDIALGAKALKVFTISPRTLDPRAYWDNIRNVARWSERYDCTGVLLFAGNDTYLEPWVVAQAVLADTLKVAPLIAVNPVYMHPFTAAKMVSSYAQVYGRKVYLNMITGTAVSYLEALNDRASHDDRYERLLEYTHILQALVSSTRPVSYSGRYYQVADLQLLPGVPAGLQPEFLVSGQSEAALRVTRAIGAVGLQMLPPKVDQGLTEARAVHFGVVTRPDEAGAWAAAHELFPESLEDQEILELSMQNTDSVWKRRMHQADRLGPGEPGYWLTPFRNFKADCPYVVGDYRRVAGVVARLVRKGVEVVILDIPAREEEFRHIDRAFALSADELRAAG
jgi:alkanesulfonate monooxygenase